MRTISDLLFQPFDVVRQLSLFEIFVRILLSVFLGGIIGLERGIKNKAAGLRTYLLVTLGASIVMMTNQYIYQIFDSGDPVRMGAQVISGIGFLGAGTIIVTTKNQIRGLTSAASLWACAANGLAIGIGAYEISVMATLSLYLVIEFVHRLDFIVEKNRKKHLLYVEIDKSFELEQFLAYAQKRDIDIASIEYAKSGSGFSHTLPLILGIGNHDYHSYDKICEMIQAYQGVYYIEKL